MTCVEPHSLGEADGTGGTDLGAAEAADARPFESARWERAWWPELRSGCPRPPSEKPTERADEESK